MSGNVLEHITPAALNFFDFNTISISDLACLGSDFPVLANDFSSATWTANLLTCVPLITNQRITVSQFFWYNGVSAAGNTDVGIYNFAGTTKLGSTGSTANSGTSQVQVVDVTNFTIDAMQRFWLVLGCDDSGHSFFLDTLSVGGQDLLGVKQHAAGWSSGLPSSVTLSTPTVAKLPLFGFTKGAI